MCGRLAELHGPGHHLEWGVNDGGNVAIVFACVNWLQHSFQTSFSLVRCVVLLRMQGPHLVLGVVETLKVLTGRDLVWWSAHDGEHCLLPRQAQRQSVSKWEVGQEAHEAREVKLND